VTRNPEEPALPPEDDAREAEEPTLGRVLACYHDEWDVGLDCGAVVRSRARGKHFARTAASGKPIVPGDEVRVTPLEDGSAVIEDVLPRDTVLSRLLPGPRPVEQIIIANAEQLVTVASAASPRLNRRLLDRFLVIAEEADLRSVVVLNKIDLVGEEFWRPVALSYERAGYAVVPTCAIDGRGTRRLAELLGGAFSVLAGPSGAGKSSLLNAIEPGLGLKVREVSRKTSKGRHATTNVTVFRLKSGALVADTPGFRELGFWKIDADDLDYLFPEFRDHIPRCRYKGCAHISEPDCAVKAALAAGTVDSERYGSYVKLLLELRGRVG
jgi:ribosome biogenesis GTPase